MYSFKDLKRFGKRALVIVAHPDDESLFMGGTIAEFKRWRWTVLCVTDCDKRYNSRRRRELLRASGVYNRGGSHVESSMLGVAKKRGRFSRNEIRERVRIFIGKFGPFDIVFTHGNKGDYGHRTHRLIHNIVKKLSLPNVYSFYVRLRKGAVLMPSVAKSPRYIETIELSSASRRTKKRALNIYLKGTQRTNLSRLKGFVEHALNTRTECFIK